MGGRSEGLCRSYLAEGSFKGVSVLQHIHIRTADQEAEDIGPLRFDIYKEISEPGTYEVRGNVAEAFDGESINWNARDFPGFFYDLHEDLGREEIFIIASFADDSNRAEPGALVYFKLNTPMLAT